MSYINVRNHGKYGKALSFDGTNDYVEVSDSSSLDIADAVTVSWWHKVNSWKHCDGFIEKADVIRLRKRAVGINTGFYCDLYIDGDWRAPLAPTPFYELTKPLPLHEWPFFVFTYDSATKRFKVYLNGVKIGDEELPAGLGSYKIGTSANNVIIGKDIYGGGSVDGIIDDARIYNRALSAAEIETLFQKGPDFSSRLLAKVPKGTTQFIVTLSWQGVGSINITIESPSKNYTEDMVPMYQKTVYSTSGGVMLNIKRLVISVSALSSDENWYIVLKFDDVDDYSITVEVQR